MNTDMNILQRTQQLKALFSYENKVELEGSQIEILPVRFTQTTGAEEINNFQQLMSGNDICTIPDNKIDENKSFSYPVFMPKRKERAPGVIILLHGLNERSWEKYLTWAESLAVNTGKPVILFPIAFHMNRTPQTWYNPRTVLPWLNKRKQEILNLCNASFANVALSSRLSDNPLRFYASGRESVFNLWQLIREIRNGQHPLFQEGASVNIFAYSIGALLAEVLLLSNPENLLSESRLFMFCGGSLFNSMNGNAKDIMDQEAYNRMKHYFEHDFLNDGQSRSLPDEFKNDAFEKAFKSLITPEKHQEYRESFFEKAISRVKAISLKRDIVMPTQGIISAVGQLSAAHIVNELDFPFEYTHQSPFPANADPSLVDQSFSNLFHRAASFL